MLDTARVWPLLLLSSIALGILHYVLIVSWYIIPVFFLIVFALVIRSFFSTAELGKYTYILVILDGIFLLVSGSFQFPIFLVVYVLFSFFLIVMYRLSVKELLFFERTVLSLNDIDRKKARKALKTGSPDDIAEVAKYVSWSTV